MSRILKRNNKYELAFGRDHVFGIFLQVFSRKLAKEEPLFERNHLTIKQLETIADRLGFAVSQNDIRNI